MNASRLASIRPGQIVALAFAWPIVIMLGTITYVVAQAWRASNGQLAAIGFGWSGSVWASLLAFVILFLPPIVLLAVWRLSLRRPS